MSASPSTATTLRDVVGVDGIVWRSFSSSGGARVLYRIEGNALENIVVGHMDGAVAQRLMQAFDVVAAEHGTFVGYHSWWNAPTYTSEYRALWMAWLADKAKNGSLLETHFLTSSRIVRMGLSVANVAYPKIRFGIHDNEAAYVEKRRRHMVDAVVPAL